MKKMLLLVTGLGIASTAFASHRIRFENESREFSARITIVGKAGYGSITKCLGPRSKIDINFAPEFYDYAEVSTYEGKPYCTYQRLGKGRVRKFPFVDEMMAMARAMTPDHLKKEYDTLKNLDRVWVDNIGEIYFQGRD